jgi:predicted LPLAT superfamily acyltransferase
MHGGRAGNAFMAFLIRHRLRWLVTFSLFWAALWFALFEPKGTRASFDLADRIGRGGNLWRRFKFRYLHNWGYGTLLIDRTALMAGQKDRYEFDRPPKSMIEPLKEGTGMLFLTAHMGSWEVMGHLLAGEERVTVNMLMYEGLQPGIKQILEKGRDFKVLPADGSPASAAAVLGALRSGEIVCVMGDRLLADEGATVDFLGGRARFPVGAYALAATARVPLWYTFAVRTGPRRYHFVAEEAGPLKYTNRRNKAADHERWAQDFAARLEALVREYPTQWGNFFSLWET